MRIHLRRMKLKRILIFIILLFALTSSYVYYTLYFKHENAKTDIDDVGPHHRFPIKVPNNVGSKVNKDFFARARAQPRPHINKNGIVRSKDMKLYPHGVQKRWKTIRVPQEGPDDLPLQDTDRDQNGVDNRLKKLQKRLEQRVKLQQELREQDDVLRNSGQDQGPDENLKQKPIPLTDVARRRAQQTKEDINRARLLDSVIRRKVIQNDTIRDRKDKVEDAQNDNNNGNVFRDKAIKLAVNGIQPRLDLSHRKRIPEPVRLEQQEKQDAMQMFERARQRNQERARNLPVKPLADPGRVEKTPEAQAKGVDAVRVFDEAGRRARQQNNRLQSLFSRDNLRRDQEQNRLPKQRAEVERQNPDRRVDWNELPRIAKIRRRIASTEMNTTQDINPDHHDQPHHFPGQRADDRFVISSLHDKDSSSFRGKTKFRPGDVLQGQNRELAGDGFRNAFRDFREGTKPYLMQENGKHDGRINREDRFHDMGLSKKKWFRVQGKFQIAVKNLAESVEISAKCVPLKISNVSHVICVYPDHMDTGPSKQLTERGSWEDQELKEFQAALSTSSSLAALDIGAGLGMYSVVAASEGREVLAVEPLKHNQQLFMKTMQTNSLTDKVTLVMEALGEERGVGIVRYPHPTGNMGAVYVDRVQGDLREGLRGDDFKNQVRIVQLDDVLPLVNFTQAVMKLDVQGDEEKVLRGATRFFDKIDVQFVLMHWLSSHNKLYLKACEKFFKERGYEPARSATGQEIYSDVELDNDINFIVWRKKNTNRNLSQKETT